jgi:hypothetical protein
MPETPSRSTPRVFKLTAPRAFVPTEFSEQVAVFEWRRWQQIRQPELRLLFATLNGVRVSIGLARKMKAAGMTSGVPDLVLPIARDEYFGLFIEMKRTKGGTLSSEQEDWMCWLLNENYLVKVARGAKEAIKIIDQYLTRAKTEPLIRLRHLEK